VDQESSNSNSGHDLSLDEVRRMWECALSRLKDALEAEAAANSVPAADPPRRNGRFHGQAATSHKV
jgi:hypothetical protein